MLDVLALAREDTHLKRKSVREQSGPCPDVNCRCRHDGFNVKYNGERWVFMCRGCWDSEEILSAEVAKTIGKSHRVGEKRGWGDEIDYLRHFRSMSFQDAQHLADDSDGEITSAPAAQSTRQDYTSEPWQAVAANAMHDHIERMWSDDSRALEYLHVRRLRNDIIKWARLGYSLVGGIPRLVIPSINDGYYVAIHRRDLRQDIENPWQDAPGSAGDELYLADSLKRKLPTVLTEGPLDALSMLQEYGREAINVVATIGVTKCREPKWIAKLARMPLVLVAFDADEPGDEAAKWWLGCLPNARRLRPWLHDVNDMLVEGWDMSAWITEALEKYEDVWLQPEMPLCATCWDTSRIETEALENDYEGFMYCATHHPAIVKTEIHRIIEGLSNADYMDMLKREAQALAAEAAQPKRREYTANQRQNSGGAA